MVVPSVALTFTVYVCEECVELVQPVMLTALPIPAKSKKSMAILRRCLLRRMLKIPTRPGIHRSIAAYVIAEDRLEGNCGRSRFAWAPTPIARVEVCVEAGPAVKVNVAGVRLQVMAGDDVVQERETVPA